LDVPVEDIYEENENLAQNIENIENVSSSYIGNNNVYCNIPDYILQDLHNTINKWQEENQSLKEEIQHLKEENEKLK
ncbi:MAG: transcriptional regulator, partial [Flavobacteriaceae bacterium]|jgi:FtsZ-binding cell division protein ZapB|nr:transcriptional regulator [Flavobacteriaceae bacterium]